MTRDPDERLGSAQKDGRDVKAHAFFKSIDWEKLYNKEITPQFIPQVKSEADISHIDAVFTGEKALDSVVETSELTKNEPNAFDGFTFVSQNAMDAEAKGN